MFRAIKFRITYFLEGIRNLIAWRKVIYEDRNFDHYFIYEILKTKLKFQADHIKKYSLHQNAEEEVNRIVECIDMIDKVQNEYYIDKALDQENVTLEIMEEAEKKHNETRTKLFETLSKNIEKWWD